MSLVRFLFCRFSCWEVLGLSFSLWNNAKMRSMYQGQRHVDRWPSMPEGRNRRWLFVHSRAGCRHRRCCPLCHLVLQQQLPASTDWRVQ